VIAALLRLWLSADPNKVEGRRACLPRDRQECFAEKT